MSSPNLAAIQTQINSYLNPLFMIFGSIGNIFSLIVFSRQRQNACSIYLIVAATSNIVFLLANGFFRIFAVYNDGTIRAIILCKISYYVSGTVEQVTRTMLVLACIDRYMITSNKANFRAFSTPKRAKYLVILSIIFWLIVFIHIPIFITIVNGQCTRTGIYATIYSVYGILVVGLIPTATLCVFGYLTYRNRRQLRNRIQPIAPNTNNVNFGIQRRDRDLLIIVISEVFVYVITASLFPLVLLEMMISQYAMPNKSLQYFQAEVFTFNISTLLIVAYSASPFYIYVISSKSFRQDFKQLIINSYRKLGREPPVQTITARRNQTLALRQRDTPI